MATSQFRSPRVFVIGGASTAILATVVAGLMYWQSGASAHQIDDALNSTDPATVQNTLLALTEDQIGGEANRDRRKRFINTCKGMPIDALLAIIRADALTDEQRAALWDNLRIIGESYVREVVDDYFKLVNGSAAEEEKIAFIDQQIDEWIPFMEKMEEFRREHKDDPAMKKMEEQEKEHWKKSATREGRKERIENTNPDEQARMFFYMRQVVQRAKDRGLDMGRGRRDRDNKPAEKSDSGQNSDKR